MAASTRPIYLLYCLSGFVSLGYQIVWFRIFSDHFGSTNLTFGLVLSCFIGGLGVGSLFSRRFTDRLGRVVKLEQPLRIYGLIEILVGASALLTLAIPLLPADLWGEFPYRLVGNVHSPTLGYQLSHVAMSIVCVFLPCFLMGTTFPLLCSLFQADARLPARLYGWNTLGACSGILALEFLFLPMMGHDRAFVAMVTLNIGLGVYFLRQRHAARVEATDITPPKQETSATFSMSAITACAVVAGLVTGAFEADVLRRLQFMNCRNATAMSCISFWAILAIFASAWTVRALPRIKLSAIKVAYGIAFLLYYWLWTEAYELRESVNAADLREITEGLPEDTTGLGVPYTIDYFAYGLGATLMYTGLFVFPVFYLLSLLLPHLCNVAQAKRQHLGRMYGANTIAFCVGLMVFTSIAPRLSVFYSLKLFFIVFAVLGLAFAAMVPGRRLGIWRPAVATALLAAAAIFTPAGFDADLLSPRSQARLYPVRAMKSNGAHTTYVVDDPSGDLLFFDSHTMSGCNLPSQKYMRLMAHFPLLANEAPRKALLICFGVGNTASAIAAHETIESIDVVDLNDQVLATASEFAEYNRGVVDDPRVRLIHDDGRRFLNLTTDSYDLITSEPPPPMFAGMHRLYSIEYYEDARRRLTDRGLMTQWLPIGQMPRAAVQQAISTFIAVFPDAVLFVGSSTNYILMGGKGPIDLPLAERRFSASGKPTRDLQRLDIRTPRHLLARIAQAGPSLRREYGPHEVISDKGTGFSRLFVDSDDPAVITYDPETVLEEIDFDRFECGAELRATLTHLGRLKYAVPDLPPESLESVRLQELKDVALWDVDWRAIERLDEVARQVAASGQHQNATVFLARALQRNDQLPHIVRRVAMIQGERGKLDLALNAWRRLRVLEPNDPEGHFGTGATLAAKREHEQALGPLRRAVAVDRGRVVHYRRALGDSLVELGRWREAVRAYDQALAIDSSDAASMKGRERCLKELERGR